MPAIAKAEFAATLGHSEAVRDLATALGQAMADRREARELAISGFLGRAQDQSERAAVRVDMTPHDPEWVEVVRACWDHELAGEHLGGALAPAAFHAATITHLMADAKRARSGMRRLFARGSTRDAADTAYAQLVDGLSGPLSQFAGQAQAALAGLTPTTPSTAMVRHAASPGVAYAAVAELAGIAQGLFEATVVEVAVAREAQRVHRAVSFCVETQHPLAEMIREQFAVVRADMVNATLDEMPIESLRDTAAAGLRLGAITRAGYRTVRQVAGATPARLMEIEGVGDHTARQVVAAARQVATAVNEDLKFRINLDPSDVPTSQLINALCALAFVRRPVRGSIHDLPRYRDELQPFGGRSLPSVGLIALVPSRRPHVAPGGAPELWLPVRDAVEARVAWAQSLQLVGQVDQVRQMFDQARPNDEESWEDFRSHAPEYYTMLEEIVGLKTDDATTYGHLPADIAERVRAFALDTSLCRVSLRGYQEFGAKFALVQERALLGDEMGLGKTIQALAAMAHLASNGASHFFVVAPASVLYNWQQEIRRKSTLQTFLAHGIDRDRTLGRWADRGGVAITTFATLAALTIPPDVTIGLLVVDEAHYVKNPRARRSQDVRHLVQRSPRTLFMTGTPIENRVEEFSRIVSVLQPPQLADLNWELAAVTGSRFRRAVAPTYLRRNQEDVLHELPEIVQVDEWLPFSCDEAAAYREEVMAGRFPRMRQTAMVADPRQGAKMTRLIEIVDEATANDRKVLVFSYFRAVLAAVTTQLGPRTAGLITGSVPAAQRHRVVDSFNRPGGPAVLVSQIEAGGVGLNLQAASVVILCEPQVKPTLETQAIARAHRMGQVQSVQVHRLLSQDTVDERMLEILDTKAAVFNEYARHSSIAQVSPEAIDISERALATEVIRREQKRLTEELIARRV